MAADLATQSPIMHSLFRKEGPARGDYLARNDLFSGRLSSGVASQKTFTVSAQAPAPLQTHPAKQAHNSKQPVSNTQSREQQNTRNLQPTNTTLNGTTFTHPAELFKASWKIDSRREVKQIKKNRASSRFSTSSVRSTVGRPKTTDVVARRLISQALGVNLGRERGRYFHK
jgi:hypothetical protein